MQEEDGGDGFAQPGLIPEQLKQECLFEIVL
jgi:hypothetical protein